MPKRHPAAGTRFLVDLIKPSHYDDDGYVIQWRRAWIPSGSLACLHGLTRDAAERRVLGPEVTIAAAVYDETNKVVSAKTIIRRHRGQKGLICFIGVQTNQFPRALDLARRFRAAGLQVIIGGFHVSGCLAMLPELPADLREALDLGVSLFAGEAEGGRLDTVFQDAFRGKLEAIYNHLGDLPNLQGAIVPHLPREIIKRTSHSVAAFDAGRGCPFECSFCTIINVQGRKSRWRDADDVERIVRAAHQEGIKRLFITDDNFARNKNWEAIFDRLAALREQEGIPLKLIIQVDMLSHRIPGFIDKARRAGVGRIFIGLESINPNNLRAANKPQNRIAEYRAMLQAWREASIVTFAGYIIGFPADTPERIAEDIETIKRELPVDLISFFFLTPLPGSVDHRKALRDGAWLEPDMNRYDAHRVCAEHPLMSKDQWARTVRSAWDRYYSDDHVRTLMRRTMASGHNPIRIWSHVCQYYGTLAFENVHPLEGGYIRRKLRTQRRSGMKLENPLVFYPKRFAASVWKHARMLRYMLRLYIIYERVRRDPARAAYSDFATRPLAIEPADDGAPLRPAEPPPPGPEAPPGGPLPGLSKGAGS